MPRNIKKILSGQSSAKIYSPKFFDASRMTGTGGDGGLLSKQRNPVNIPASVKTNPLDVDPWRKIAHNGSIELAYIPMFAMSSMTWQLINEIEVGDLTQACDVATDPFGNIHYYLRTSIHSVTTDKDTTKVPGAKRQKYPVNLTAIYRVELIRIEDPNNDHCKVIHSNKVGDLVHAQGNAVHVEFKANVPKLFENLAHTLEHFGCAVKRNTLADYLRGLSLYDMVVDRSNIWQESLDKEILPLFESLDNKSTNDSFLSTEAKALVTTVARLESYSVPLDVYGRIYKNICDHFTPDIVASLCKHNLNIMLSELMTHLRKDKAQLNRVPKVPGVSAGARCNAEQRAAAETDEPLAIIQACAGAGKTTTIIERIAYMIAAGVDPSDICVISFTNAAADNIKELNKEVKSMTIDSMIVNIYQHNFPGQEISTSQTFANGLDAYFTHDPVAEKLRSLIIAVDNNIEGSFTKLNRFVESNIKEIGNMCQTIGHVTLSLAIVMCYQLIDNMTEPDNVTASHMIMDEVQDTSIFQFVYALKHVHKYRQSLFIVGDSSQTLYEFRFANPRALNVMESSGVFHPYKLQTNYRSRPEILEMANVTLENIEANQVAQLRLESNQLRTPTRKSFEDAVHVSYSKVSSKVDFLNSEARIISLYAKDYIDDIIARGENVAILAFSHKEIDEAARALETLYPDKEIVSLAPARSGESTTMSRFVKLFWNEVRFLPTNDIIRSIRRMMLDKLDDIEVGLKRPNMDWLRDKATKIINDWASDDATKACYLAAKANLDAGNIRQSAFFDEIKRSIFAYESRINIEQQLSVSQANNKLRENAINSKATFLVSTIHSAKGLEWNNVIVIYNETTTMNEQTKRLYYVALTRAMNSEFIIAYGKRTEDNSPIVNQHKAVAAQLEAAEKAAAKAAAGIPTDTDAANEDA